MTGAEKKKDFEGFGFLEYDNTYQSLSPDCDRKHNVVVDLKSYRLIGFKVTISDFNDNF